MAKPLPKAWIREHQDNANHGPYLTDPSFFHRDYPEPITDRVPKHLREGGVGRVQRPKEAHQFSFRYAQAHVDEPGLRIVYGIRLGYIDHSWVELPGNITFDGTRQEFYETDAYRAMIGASVIRSYTAIETSVLAGRTDHSGPWTEADCLRLLGYVPQGRK